MTKDLYDKEIRWKNCLFRNRCPILDLNNGLLSISMSLKLKKGLHSKYALHDLNDDVTGNCRCLICVLIFCFRSSDMFCFELLSMVSALSGSGVGREYLAQQYGLLKDLFSLLHTASPRVQRQVRVVSKCCHLLHL